MARLSDYRDLLPEGTLNAWPAVASALPEGGSLMGGTGLAIWLRHRRSEDLDIFCLARFDVDSVLAGLSAAGEFLLTDASERLIRGVFNDVNVDIVVDEGAHQLGPTLEIDGLHVASLQDIAAGKFKAITGRKQLRDFIDMMFIETAGGINIEQAIMLHFRRYGIDPSYSQVSGVLGHLVDFGRRRPSVTVRFSVAESSPANARASLARSGLRRFGKGGDREPHSASHFVSEPAHFRLLLQLLPTAARPRQRVVDGFLNARFVEDFDFDVRIGVFVDVHCVSCLDGRRDPCGQRTGSHHPTAV